MNRADRRRFNKKNHTNYTREQMDAIEMYAKLRSGNIDIKHISDFKDNKFIKFDGKALAPDGTEVMLRYDAIKSRPNKLADEYVEFIEKHKEEILHISRKNTEGKPDTLVTVEEDPESIWLFDIYSDLLFKNEDGNWDIL